mgnify:CR=1 FL=1
MSATPGETPKPYKRPVSVLVLIHTPERQILLLERASHPGYWQSVTGSQEGDEPLDATARREVLEETGIDIARRTVAKYREALRIPSSVERRRMVRGACQA